MPVVLSGVNQLQRNLRRFQPDAAKALRKRVGAALKPLAASAKNKVPTSALSGWERATGGSFPRYDHSFITRGIGYTTGSTRFNNSGFNYVASVFNASAVGAIAETAGRTNPNGQRWVGPHGPAGKRYSHSTNPNAGRQFINALGPVGTGKAAGRYIFKAFDESQGKVTEAVVQAYEDAAIKFYGKGLK